MAADELLPTRLLRGATGERAVEAAVMFLINSGTPLEHLASCIVVDLEHDTANIDWDAVSAIAGHHTTNDRAVTIIAAAIATEGPHITAKASTALTQALNHIATSSLQR